MLHSLFPRLSSIPVTTRFVFVVTFSLFTAVSAAVSRGEEAIEIYSSDRRSTLRRTGVIEEYSGAGAVLLVGGSRRETIPLAKIALLDSPPTPAEVAAERLAQAGKLAEAVAALRDAVRKEPRRWVARRMAIRLSDLYELADQSDSAADAFLAVVREDSQTPYFSAIPLAWKASAGDTAAAGHAKAKLAGTNDPAGMLIGASRLLSGAERPRAIATLELLEQHEDSRISQLAAAQLWRNSIATATANQLEARYRTLATWPEALRSGPRLVLAETSLRLGRTEEALEEALKSTLLMNDRSSLRLTAVELAGKILEKQERANDAARLYGDVLERIPSSPRTAELESRRRAIQSTLGGKAP